MLAEVIENHPPTADRSQCFYARITYVCSTATTVMLVNLAGVWGEAAPQMQFAAARNVRMRTPVCHIAVSWSETEALTDMEMINAAKMLLSELGADGHQAVIGVHRKDGHAHIVLNLIHPVTGKTLSLSNDFARLELGCRRIEHRRAWPPDRGRFDTDIVEGEVELRPKPAAHWARKTEARLRGVRPDGRAAIEYDQRTGAGYLRDRISQTVLAKVRATLDDARDWLSVHLGLAKTGFQYVPFRSGARIYQTATQLHMPAGQLGTVYGLRQMERRIGRYVSSMLALPVSRTPRRAERRQKLRSLQDAQAQERTALRATLRGRRSPLAQALRAQMHEDHKAARVTLKEELRVRDPDPQPAPLYPELVRYRHAIRQKLSSIEPPDDHTARRQDWILSLLDPAVATDTLPEGIGDLIARYPDTVRADGIGGLLFAGYGRNGSILSFARLSLGATSAVRMPVASPDGICAIGPHPADTCLLVCAPFDAMVAMLQIDGPMPMVIVVGEALNQERAAQIAWLAKGRKVAISDAGFAEVPATLNELHRMFPDAKFWADRPDMEPDPADTYGDDVADMPPVNDMHSP